jgi:hypothetical protein
VVGEINVGGVEGGGGGAAEEDEGALNVGAEDIEGAGDAGLASGGQSIGVGATDEDGFGAEAEGFDDVGTATNATIHEDFDAAVDGGNNFGQSAERGGDAVELAASVIGDDEGGGAFVHGAAGIVSGEHTFDDDGAGPDFAEPAKILPSDDRGGESGGDVDERHGTFARLDNILKRRRAAIEEKSGEPSGMREDLRNVRNFGEERIAEKLLHAIAGIAFTHASDGSVDGDDQSGIAGATGAFESGFGDGASTNEIKLIPRGASGGGFHVFKLVRGNGGEGVEESGGTRGGRGGEFSPWMDEAAVADRSKNGRESERLAEDLRAKIGIGNGNGLARTEGDVVKNAAIFAESDFALGATIEIIEDDFGKAALRQGAEIVNVDDARRTERRGRIGHTKWILSPERARERNRI